MKTKYRKKGRKIYTYRAKNRKMFHHSHPLKTGLGIFLTVALAAVLGIVGYSIVGPVMDRLTAEEQNPTKTDDPYFESSSESAAETTVRTETDRPETTTSSESFASVTQTETQTEATETETTESNQPEQRFPAGISVAYLLTDETAADLKLLRSAAEMYAAQGYTELLLPMKLSGGSLQYASNVKAAQKSGASAESPALDEILEAASSAGMQCSAVMNLLDDQIYPAQYAEGSYQVKNNRGRWYDRAVSDGGKPWLSPFTDAARKYLADLAGELTEAGFQSVICEGFTFPRFRNSDVELLGKKVTDEENRPEAIRDTLNKIAESAPQAAVNISLSDIIKGAEPCKIDEGLQMNTIYLEIGQELFNTSFVYQNQKYSTKGLDTEEKIRVLLDAAQSAANGRELIIAVGSAQFQDSDLSTLVYTAHDLGISKIVLT